MNQPPLSTSPAGEADLSHPSSSKVPHRPSFASRIGVGLALGGVIGVFVHEAGFPRVGEHAWLFVAAAGALIGLTRLRRVLWGLVAVCLLTVLVIGYSPLADWLLRDSVRSDPPVPVSAIVVLGAGAHSDGTLTAPMMARTLEGYRLLRAGWSDRLVLTRGVPADGEIQWDPVIRRQMSELGLTYSVDTVGPCANTHDEAIKVAELAKERGWKKVIIVTSPSHTRRAAATFEKTGLEIVCVSCGENQYDYNNLRQASGRIAAFRFWMREAIGLKMYRWRGWA